MYLGVFLGRIITGSRSFGRAVWGCGGRGQVVPSNRRDGKFGFRSDFERFFWNVIRLWFLGQIELWVAGLNGGAIRGEGIMFVEIVVGVTRDRGRNVRRYISSLG